MTRAGHSLPELIVAVTFLATSLVAVGSTSVLGARTAARAVTRQEALRLAHAVLDSLDRHAPGSGSLTVDGLVVRWTGADMDGLPGTRITVHAGDGGPLLTTLLAPRPPDLPVLPGPGPDPGAWGPSKGGP